MFECKACEAKDHEIEWLREQVAALTRQVMHMAQPFAAAAALHKPGETGAAEEPFSALPNYINSMGEHLDVAELVGRGNDAAQRADAEHNRLVAEADRIIREGM